MLYLDRTLVDPARLHLRSVVPASFFLFSMVDYCTCNLLTIKLAIKGLIRINIQQK
jgi:hypothetical protein